MGRGDAKGVKQWRAAHQCALVARSLCTPSLHSGRRRSESPTLAALPRRPSPTQPPPPPHLQPGLEAVLHVALRGGLEGVCHISGLVKHHAVQHRPAVAGAAGLAAGARRPRTVVRVRR